MKTRIGINGNWIENDYKRIFLISDIHNDYINFCNMRNLLNWGKEDLVIVVGDIVDRGCLRPDPLGICSDIRFSENREYDAIMLKGNHEKWLSKAIEKYMQTGEEVYQYESLRYLADQLTGDELLGYAAWMGSLPLGMEMEVEGFKKAFRIAHASTFDMNSEKESLMGSVDFYKTAINDEKYTNVVGHTITPLMRFYFSDYEKRRIKTDADIFMVKDRLWCIDCGNGYRDCGGLEARLGCIELCGKGKVKEHYI